MISLQRTDFDTIGDVARHCDLNKLQIAINEAIEFDLKPLLCSLYYDVNDNWIGSGDFNADFNLDFDTGTSMPEEYLNLIYPHEYVDCRDRKSSHSGLKQILTRYSYARYVILNPFSDTPNGGVSKTNTFSIPKPYADLKQVSDRYRSMAFNQWKEVEHFLCLNKELYNVDFLKCAPCGCNGRCGSSTKVKGYGIKSSNISSKYGL